MAAATAPRWRLRRSKRSALKRVPRARTGRDALNILLIAAALHLAVVPVGSVDTTVRRSRLLCHPDHRVHYALLIGLRVWQGRAARPHRDPD